MRDPRWEGIHVEAAASASWLTSEELDEIGYSWFKLWLCVHYKGVAIYNQQAMHPDDVEDLYGTPEIRKFIWSEMIRRIDEGMDRVDAGEREF